MSNFAQWIASYFDHGDLSKRDPDVLEYISPSLTRRSSISNMSLDQISDIVETDAGYPVDLSFIIPSQALLEAVYTKVNFDKALKKQIPHLRNTFIAGDLAASFSLAALWALQEDDEKNGGGNIKFIVVPNANHFVSWFLSMDAVFDQCAPQMHWDDPEKTVEAYLEAVR